VGLVLLVGLRWLVGAGRELWREAERAGTLSSQWIDS